MNFKNFFFKKESPQEFIEKVKIKFKVMFYNVHIHFLII